MQKARMPSRRVAHLGGIEPGEVLLKDVAFDEQVEEVAATHEFEDLGAVCKTEKTQGRAHHVEIVGVLEAVEETHDPVAGGAGVGRGGLEDFALGADMALLPAPQHVCLAELGEE